MGSIFSSRPAAQIAAALVLHPHTPLRKNELVRVTGLGWPYVQRGLASLKRLGLLRVIASKGYEVYEIDPATPYLPAIQRAALVDCGIVEALAPLAPRLRFVMVIGSFAWGHPTMRSDLDLLVVGGASRDEIAEALEPLEKRYERSFDPIVYSDEEMHARLGADDYLLRNAITGGLRILGDPSLVPA